MERELSPVGLCFKCLEVGLQHHVWHVLGLELPDLWRGAARKLQVLYQVSRVEQSGSQQLLPGSPNVSMPQTYDGLCDAPSISIGGFGRTQGR